MDRIPIVPDHVAKITGPLLIGYLLNWGLFGVLAMQIYIYYIAFRKEPLCNRLLVYCIFALMLVQTIMLSQRAFDTFARGFGQIDTVDDIGHLWFSVPILGSIVASSVQSYFAFRITVMSKDKRIPAVIVFLSLIQLAGGISTGIIGHGYTRFSMLQAGTAGDIAVGIWNGAGTLCDIIIAVCMVHHYVSPKSSWRLRPVRVPIYVRLPFQSGIVLAAVALANTVLSLLPGRQTYFQTTSCILGNMYANTLLIILNSSVRIGRPSAFVDSDYVSDASFGSDTELRSPRSALVFATVQDTAINNNHETRTRAALMDSGGTSSSGTASNGKVSTQWTDGRETGLTNISEETKTFGSINLIDIEMQAQEPYVKDIHQEEQKKYGQERRHNGQEP